jgi:low affinity Fe/Cu permease
MSRWVFTKRRRIPPAAAGGTALDPVAFTLMIDALRRALTRLGEFTTHPTAFAIVAAFTVAWLLFSPGTFGWAAVASLATWMMTLFINRTGYRDTQALHAKLDELLRTHGDARTELTALDESDVEDIEEHRREQRERDASTNREKPRRAR